jgi:hypothetical protein
MSIQIAALTYRFFRSSHFATALACLQLVESEHIGEPAPGDFDFHRTPDLPYGDPHMLRPKSLVGHS